MLRAVPILAVLALALAGCVAPANDVGSASTPDLTTFAPVTPAAPDFDFAKVVDPDHANHQLPMLHAGGHGLALTGFASVQDIVPPPLKASITQVDVQGGYALVSGMEGGLAFAILDITDPAKPKAVSYWPSAAQGWTARFSEDGNYVFYGCQMLGVPSGLATGTYNMVKGDCKDPNAPHAPGSPQGGIVVVDVHDKAKPTFVDFLPGMAAHNLFVASINGTDYVFTNGVNIIKFDAAAGKLEEVANVPGVHDATVARHPITGDWLMFTGTQELSIYNVNDPAAPEVVWEAPKDKKEFVGWHEQTLIPGVVDGRVVLALGGESYLSASGVPDIVSFVDVTDPERPALLSQWKPPFESKLPWAGYLYSVHEMAATPQGQVAISWYHGGVWVVDVSTKERQAEPVTLAAYLPNKLPTAIPSQFWQTAVPYVPFVWGAGWDARGYLVVPDMHTGVYVMEPEWGLVPTIDGGQ